MALGRDAQRDKRRRIAAFVKTHGKNALAVDEACAEFGVSVSTVRNSCREFKVVVTRKVQQRVTLSVGTYTIIAALCTTTYSLKDIAEKNCVTPQWVSQVYRACKRAGVPVNERKKGRST